MVNCAEIYCVPLQVLAMQGNFPVFLWITLWTMWKTAIGKFFLVSYNFTLCQQAFRHVSVPFL